jgi:hypothetical protein
MIWHLAVHPDCQRQGIGGRLLHEAQRRAAVTGISCFEVWTRDDAATLRWYESHGFEWVTSYLHVYMQGKAEVEQAIRSLVPDLKPVQVFAHYVGTDTELIRHQFARVHDCNCFRLCFSGSDSLHKGACHGHGSDLSGHAPPPDGPSPFTQR